MNKPKIVFTCGGTGGHVYPAIALAQHLENYTPIFIGSTHRMDSKIVPRYGFEYVSIAQGASKILGLFHIFIQARRYLKKHSVRAVIGAGGFYTAAVVLAAFSLRKPVFLLEQNAIPGRTNRMLQFFAKRIYLTFEESRRYFGGQKLLVTGNPVRKVFLEDDMYRYLKALPLPNVPKILVFGGSQGAKALNSLIHQQHSFFLNQPYLLIHVTGEAYYKAHFEDMPATLVRNSVGEIKVVVLPYFEKMDWLFEQVKCVVSRSGATTLSEIAWFGCPAFLIPFPYAKDNHQLANALAFQSKQESQICLENELTFNRLEDFFEGIMERKSTGLLKQEDASDHILKDLYEYIQ